MTSEEYLAIKKLADGLTDKFQEQIDIYKVKNSIIDKATVNVFHYVISIIQYRLGRAEGEFIASVKEQEKAVLK